MKKVLLIILSIVLTLLSIGIIFSPKLLEWAITDHVKKTRFVFPELGDNPIVFNYVPYTDKENKKDLYLTLEYNGRKYFPYSERKGLFNSAILDKCLGYVNIGNHNTEMRIFTLVDDKENNYIIEVNINSFESYKPIFYRAIDTKEIMIAMPPCVNPVPINDFWELRETEIEIEAEDY